MYLAPPALYWSHRGHPHRDSLAGRAGQSDEPSRARHVRSAPGSACAHCGVGAIAPVADDIRRQYLTCQPALLRAGGEISQPLSVDRVIQRAAHSHVVERRSPGVEDEHVRHRDGAELELARMLGLHCRQNSRRGSGDVLCHVRRTAQHRRDVRVR